MFANRISNLTENKAARREVVFSSCAPISVFETPAFAEVPVAIVPAERRDVAQQIYQLAYQQAQAQVIDQLIEMLLSRSRM